MSSNRTSNKSGNRLQREGNSCLKSGVSGCQQNKVWHRGTTSHSHAYVHHTTDPKSGHKSGHSPIKRTISYSEKPVTTDLHVPVAQLPERLGSDLDIAEKGQVGDFHQPDFLQGLALLFHLQLVAGLADHGPLCMNIYRNRIVPGRSHPANVLGLNGLALSPNPPKI